MKLNNNLYEISNNPNVFANITKQVQAYKQTHPEAQIVSLGIGDVSKPICAPIIKAMHEAVNDLSKAETFKGYGAYFGYDFLKEAIINNDYKNEHFTKDEVYISNGTKTDTTSILELFDANTKIMIADVIYPIYRDGSLALNHHLDLIETNEQLEAPIPKLKYDLIYLCSPSNPLGIAYTYQALTKWVNYAIKNKAVILYDNVYESFIQSKDVPHSIYEIEGAKKCAIEFRSFSKKASFTGVRCSYYVIPKEIDPDINKLWQLRTINRFNGADYIAQVGALASYQPDAQSIIKENMAYYHHNTKLILATFKKLGFTTYGGIDAPYVWVKIKEDLTSWDLFQLYLTKLNIIVIPGIIFGENGDHYFRVSGLGTTENTKEALKRIECYYEKKA